MNKGDLLRYKALLLANQQELSASKSLVGSVPAASEPWGNSAHMATTEAGPAMQMRLNQAGSRLSVAIEDALARIRQERFGICEECGQPISRARLEVAPWTRHCKHCKEQQDSRS